MEDIELAYTESPDMVAYTIGRVVMSLMDTGSAISDDMIVKSLVRIVDNGPGERVSPEMAKGALIGLWTNNNHRAARCYSAAIIARETIAQKESPES